MQLCVGVSITLFNHRRRLLEAESERERDLEKGDGVKMGWN